MYARKIIGISISAAIALAAGAAGSFFTSSGLSWYETVAKPALTPPAFLFGPVWTALYILMGLAAYLIWEKRREFPAAKYAIGLYFLQLGLNALWSVLFFGFRNPGGALIEIAILWLTIIATIIAFAELGIGDRDNKNRKSVAWFYDRYAYEWRTRIENFVVK